MPGSKEFSAQGSIANPSASVNFSRNPGTHAELLLRLICFFLCVPSGFALMVKVYGLMEMRPFVLAVCLPCIALLLILVWATRARFPLIGSDLAIGAVAGLVGAVAYDLVRIPAVLVGYRVFGTISVFGLWLLNAEKSSRFTELAGWSYNYFNGICFGMMYALFMRGRHWGFGVLWAFILESIAIFTPFGLVFSVRGNVPVMLIAYGAHIAYGVPLGKAVQKWQSTRTSLAQMPRVVRLTLLAAAILLLTHPLYSPGSVAADHRAAAGVFRVEGLALNPDWLRVQRGQSVIVSNAENHPVTVVFKELGQRMSLRPGESAQSPQFEPGIYQVFVETSGRTQSSFVLVEPVEQGK
jgi:hypothetical protein